MPFRVQYKGLMVFCDSFAELDMLAEQASRQRARNTLIATPTTTAVSTDDKTHDDEPPLWLFIKALPEKTIAALSALVANGAMTDKQLRAALTLENNMQLAGRLAPVSRNAKKYGIKPESVLKTKVLSNKPGSRKYEYDVMDEAKSYIRRRTHGTAK